MIKSVRQIEGGTHENLFKRIITTILVLTMVMGFNVPFSATTVMAASITYNVSSTIKGVLTDDGVLTISGTGLCLIIQR